MSAYKFFLGVYGIKCDADLKEGINIGQKLRISSSKKFFGILKRKEVSNIIGLLEIRALSEAPLVVYGEFSKNFSKNDEAQRYIYALSNYVNAYLHSLWLYKDCRVFVEQGFLIDEVTLSVHSQRDLSHSTQADGSLGEVIFPKSTLVKTAKAFKQNSTDHPDRKQNYILNNPDRWYAHNDTFSEYGSTRYSRFMGFIGLARQSADLGIKIANYTTALEALVTSSGGELRHQLAERVAILDEPQSRLETFQQVQKLYDVRSRVLHGDVIPKKSDLKAISISADNVCRQIAYRHMEDRIFSESLTDSKRLKDYFIEKLLL